MKTVLLCTFRGSMRSESSYKPGEMCRDFRLDLDPSLPVMRSNAGTKKDSPPKGSNGDKEVAGIGREENEQKDLKEIEKDSHRNQGGMQDEHCSEVEHLRRDDSKVVAVDIDNVANSHGEMEGHKDKIEKEERPVKEEKDGEKEIQYEKEADVQSQTVKKESEPLQSEQSKVETPQVKVEENEDNRMFEKKGQKEEIVQREEQKKKGEAQIEKGMKEEKQFEQEKQKQFEKEEESHGNLEKEEQKDLEEKLQEQLKKEIDKKLLEGKREKEQKRPAKEDETEKWIVKNKKEQKLCKKEKEKHEQSGNKMVEMKQLEKGKKETKTYEKGAEQDKKELEKEHEVQEVEKGAQNQFEEENQEIKGFEMENKHKQKLVGKEVEEQQIIKQGKEEVRQLIKEEKQGGLMKDKQELKQVKQKKEQKQGLKNRKERQLEKENEEKQRRMKGEKEGEEQLIKENEVDERRLGKEEEQEQLEKEKKVKHIRLGKEMEGREQSEKEKEIEQRRLKNKKKEQKILEKENEEQRRLEKEDDEQKQLEGEEHRKPNNEEEEQENLEKEEERRLKKEKEEEERRLKKEEEKERQRLDKSRWDQATDGWIQATKKGRKSRERKKSEQERERKESEQERKGKDSENQDKNSMTVSSIHSTMEAVDHQKSPICASEIDDSLRLQSKRPEESRISTVKADSEEKKLACKKEQKTFNSKIVNGSKSPISYASAVSGLDSPKTSDEKVDKSHEISVKEKVDNSCIVEQVKANYSNADAGDLDSYPSTVPSSEPEKEQFTKKKVEEQPVHAAVKPSPVETVKSAELHHDSLDLLSPSIKDVIIDESTCEDIIKQVRQEENTKIEKEPACGVVEEGSETITVDKDFTENMENDIDTHGELEKSASEVEVVKMLAELTEKISEEVLQDNIACKQEGVSGGRNISSANEAPFDDSAIVCSNIDGLLEKMKHGIGSAYGKALSSDVRSDTVAAVEDTSTSVMEQRSGSPQEYISLLQHVLPNVTSITKIKMDSPTKSADDETQLQSTGDMLACDLSVAENVEVGGIKEAEYTDVDRVEMTEMKERKESLVEEGGDVMTPSASSTAFTSKMHNYGKQTTLSEGKGADSVKEKSKSKKPPVESAARKSSNSDERGRGGTLKFQRSERKGSLKDSTKLKVPSKTSKLEEGKGGKGALKDKHRHTSGSADRKEPEKSKMLSSDASTRNKDLKSGGACVKPKGSHHVAGIRKTSRSVDGSKARKASGGSDGLSVSTKKSPSTSRKKVKDTLQGTLSGLSSGHKQEKTEIKPRPEDAAERRNADCQNLNKDKSNMAAESVLKKCSVKLHRLQVGNERKGSYKTPTEDGLEQNKISEKDEMLNGSTNLMKKSSSETILNVPDLVEMSMSPAPVSPSVVEQASSSVGAVGKFMGNKIGRKKSLSESEMDTFVQNIRRKSGGVNIRNVSPGMSAGVCKNLKELNQAKIEAVGLQKKRGSFTLEQDVELPIYEVKTAKELTSKLKELGPREVCDVRGKERGIDGSIQGCVARMDVPGEEETVRKLDMAEEKSDVEGSNVRTNEKTDRGGKGMKDQRDVNSNDIDKENVDSVGISDVCSTSNSKCSIKGDIVS